MCPSGCAGHGGRHASQYKRLVYSLILALLASISLGELRNTVYTEFTVSMHERWRHSYWLRCHQHWVSLVYSAKSPLTHRNARIPPRVGASPTSVHTCLASPPGTQKKKKWTLVSSPNGTSNEVSRVAPASPRPHTYEQPARARHDVASCHWPGRPSVLWPIPPPTADVAAP